MASYDAGTLTNKSKRSARIYKDLNLDFQQNTACLLYTSPSPRDVEESRMPSSA